MRTDNAKAAIAAGLWKPCSHDKNVWICGVRCRAAPDMHDPANLWRALENQQGQWLVDFSSGKYNSMLSRDGQPYRSIRGVGKTITEAVFAALVALYDAEH